MAKNWGRTVTDRIVYAVVRLLADGWINWSKYSPRQLPVPSDSPSVHSTGVDADRLLLMGNGIAVGFGAVSHDVALAGNLARSLTDLTHRGVDVEVRARPGMLVKEGVVEYPLSSLSRFDAAVVVLGDIETIRLMPAAMFRLQVRTLVAVLDRTTPRAFLVTGTAAGAAERMAPSFFGKAVANRARMFASILREECLGTNVTTIVVAPPAAGVSAGTRDNYLNWAASIAPYMVDALNSAAGATPPSEGSKVNEDDRLKALHDLGLLDDIRNPHFDSVVEMARNLFGTDTAALSLIDADYQFVKSFAGLAPENLPRDEAVCSVTIQRPELLVIEDLTADPRFQDQSWVVKPGGPRFYAGYPVESPNGQRVGALCILDSKPRTFSSQDHALLRQLAMRLQSMIGDSKLRTPPID